MIELKEYKGHIRNWDNLCSELNIEKDQEAKNREREIIIKGYERWGVEVVNHLIGMFSFAIENGDKIYCARDHFGTKPFYYYMTEEHDLLYGNQIRKIMKQDGFKKEFNHDMLQMYLNFTYCPGEDTMFKGVKKLLPGRYLVYENDKVTITRYFKPEFHPEEGKTLEEWADEISNTMEQIVKEVKMPDEEAYSFLSGGVDSSYVLAITDATTACSIGYDETALGDKAVYNGVRYNEADLAKETAEHFGRKFSLKEVGPEEYFDEIPFVMENMEMPLGDASAVTFSLGCKAAAAQNPLCYSGEGADEFFGGYNAYRNPVNIDKIKNKAYIGSTSIMREEEKQKLLKSYNPNVQPFDMVKDLYKETEGEPAINTMSMIDIINYLEGDIYLNVDKTSTAHGLEIRMPLTDIRMFDIASRLPADFKVTEEQNKIALRTAASKVLPEEVAFRKKLGFVVPVRFWLAEEPYASKIREKFTSPSAEKFFNTDELVKILDEYVNGNSNFWLKTYVIYVFLVWYDIYFG